MHIFRLILIFLMAVTLLFACKKTETELVKETSPAYCTEETKAPAYGGAETAGYGGATVPAYGGAYGEAEIAGYGEAKAPAYGEAEIPGYGKLAGNIEKGNILFNDPTLGGSANDKSCNSCHPGGKGLETSGSKTRFSLMGQEQSSLEAAVNICIVMPLKGKAINPVGKDMKDIVAYIKSLKK